ncbi:diacylglycerol kinase [Nitratiruptor sp. YY09-18]|uniref:diacylglycerol kinase n=1 Tax=Nitratiruptor sp. YY09-18 TaxID=2724901 RepID=UPI001914EED5|nr:diacylglycerol kinase [Nitratiruptor sp. YY09-18]BCD67345.1 diacylglycerol kinase (ATP) [Nitratiruptor sp. YY09-18]
MRNQPKYHLFKNARYALSGLIAALKQEMSFRIEVFLFIILSIAFWMLPLPLSQRAILQFSLFLPLIVELLNSAIERVVDLAMPDIHPLAKEAKDMGAAAVMLSLFATLCLWLYVALKQI